MLRLGPALHPARVVVPAAAAAAQGGFAWSGSPLNAMALPTCNSGMLCSAAASQHGEVCEAAVP